MVRVLDLFCGSKSFSKWVWRNRPEWSVTSLDINARVCPDILTDVRKWDFKALSPDLFDFIWASPDCSQYSVAKTRGVRDLARADSIAQATLAIIDYFKPRLGYVIENPRSSMLWQREFMAKHRLHVYDVSYCKYHHFGFQKHTRLCTEIPCFVPKFCRFDCDQLDECGKHMNTIGSTWEAGRSVSKLSTKHSVPQALIHDIMTAALAANEEEEEQVAYG